MVLFSDSILPVALDVDLAILILATICYQPSTIEYLIKNVHPNIYNGKYFLLQFRFFGSGTRKNPNLRVRIFSRQKVESLGLVGFKKFGYFGHPSTYYIRT